MNCATTLTVNFLIYFKAVMNPFLPEEHRAPVIHKKALAIYISILLSFYLFLNFFKTAAPGILGFASNIFVEEIVEVTNAYRRENSISELRLDPTLSRAAQKKAEDMFADDYWAHVAPDGTKPWYFITAVGYDYVYAGENLAKDFQKSESVVVAWMDSPTHRQNILNDRFKDIGVAVVNGTLNGYETTLVVEMFGRRPPEALAKGGQSSPTQVAGTSPATTSQVEPPEESPVEIPSESISTELPQEAYREAQWSLSAQTRPKVDVFSLTRSLSLALGSMVLGFFTLDTYTARKRGLVRLSGHTVAHFGLLILLLGFVWFLKPGAVL